MAQISRMFLIKQSIWMSLIIIILNLSFFFFVKLNMHSVDRITECLLAIPCATAVTKSSLLARLTRYFFV